jgi:hypothetical protein
MFVFTINDMRVSSQADAITSAMRHADQDACISVRLDLHEVSIVPSTAGATELSDAIVHAGFHPSLLSNESPGALGRRPAKIPFEGLDHDFSVPMVFGDEAAMSALDTTVRHLPTIAGVSGGTSVLPAEALGPLAPKRRAH